MTTYIWDGKKVSVDLEDGFWEAGRKFYTAYVEDNTIACVEFGDLEVVPAPPKSYQFTFSGFDFVVFEQDGLSIQDYARSARYILSQRSAPGARRSAQQLFRRMGAKAPSAWNTRQALSAIESFLKEFQYA